MEINTIVTHRKPHLDEMLAIYLLRLFGRDSFPNVENAEVVYDGSPGALYQGLPEDDLLEQGFLLVGVGGGQFDEHREGEPNGRLANECAATLVASFLGLRGAPDLKTLLGLTLDHDQHGSSRGGLDLSLLVSNVHADPLNSPDEALAWALMAIRATHHKDCCFWVDGKAAYDGATKKPWDGPKGKLEVVIGQTDTPTFSRYARHRGASVVIQRRSTGHVLIFATKQLGLADQLRDLVGMLRVEQARRDHRPRIEVDRLRADGTIAEVPEFYFHPEAGWVFNGSESTSQVPATTLPFEDVVMMARIALDPKRYYSKYTATCQKGGCHRACPWGAYGLPRCDGPKEHILDASS